METYFRFHIASERLFSTLYCNSLPYMNIHEYQAKELFEHYNIPVPKGVPVHEEGAITEALKTFADRPVVVKSQIHAGGRGKGTFTDGYKGGVKVCKSPQDAEAAAKAMLGKTLVTHQTGPAGRQVRTLYFTEVSDIQKEYYLAIVMDRESSRPVIIASTEGGMDIEEVAQSTPEKIIKCPIHPALGLRPHEARRVAFALGFTGETLKQCMSLLTQLYKCFWEKDCSLLEINPLITTPEGDLIALDAKVTIDDNALYRHPDIKAYYDPFEDDPKEVEASKHKLSYIALDGNIACMVNGAGLAMSTMDIIKQHGGEPANFLDVGGGADEAQVTAAFNIILSDPNVRGILVNIFGGIMKCDIIAKGIIAAANNVELSVPLVVRLEGTNVEEGRQLLASSGLPLVTADSLDDAAQKIVKLAENA